MSFYVSHFVGKNTENETSILKDRVKKNKRKNNSKEEKVLGVTSDNILTISSHIRESCKKVSPKISVLSGMSNQLNDSKKNLLFNAVVKPPFNYFPLIWMFCSRTPNNMINKVHERTLRVILGDDSNDFESLLQTNKGICSHHKNIKRLMTEMFKIKNELAAPIMDSMFERRNEPYKLRNFQGFLTEKKNCAL